MVTMFDTGIRARVQVQPCKVLSAPQAGAPAGGLRQQPGRLGAAPPACVHSLYHPRFAPKSNPAPSGAGTGEGSGIAQEAPSEECEGLEGWSSRVQPGAHCDGDAGN